MTAAENNQSVKNISGREYKYIFGPVPSRRLGRSLGIDLVPFKTCTYDCIYCQLGRTTNKTILRKEWGPLEEIISQLKDKLYLEPDYITLSGSGEPTLFTKCGELICKIKKVTSIPVAVLTNGSLLWKPDVRRSLLEADLVIPSLDAGGNHLFQYVNRPHRDISFSKMLQGLVQFRDEYKGQYWLEVFLLAGVTTPEVEIKRLQTCIKSIQPDKIQVNTVTRPPAETFAEPIPKERLEHLATQLFEHSEVIADYRSVHEKQEFVSRLEDVLTLLQRRPCSVEDIAAGLGLHRNSVIKCIEDLLLEGKIEAKSQNKQLYYKSVMK